MSVLAPIVLSLALTVGAAAPELSAAGPVREIQTATTTADPELRPWIRITKQTAVKPVPVMSIERGELPNLSLGDSLVVNAEVQVTTDCRRPSRRCAGSIYSYTPTVRGQLILRPREPGSAPITFGPERRLRCVQRRPARQHHCVLVFQTKETFLGSRQADCLPRRCSLDLDLSAANRRAGAGDRLVIGGQRPDGSIVGGHGKISAIRVPGPAEPPTLQASEDRLTDSVPLDREPRSILSVRLPQTGTFAVDARFTSDVSSTGFNDLVSSRLIVARTPRATQSQGYARIGASEGSVSPTNGTNCTLAQGSCSHRKAGVISIGPTEDPGRRPLFVNLVVSAKPKYHGGASGPASSRRLPITGASLTVLSYEPEP